jgi:electron transport complex protein RnfC
MARTTFPKGVHPPEEKDRTVGSAITNLPLPETISLPISQHLGKPPKVVKKRGDTVQLGEMLAEADGFISAHVHSPVAGKIKKQLQLPLPGGRMSEYLEIEVDPEETEAQRFSERDFDPESVDHEKLVEMLKEAGIVGMGGATFPAHVKFSPPKGKTLDTLIVNGAECEPFLTCDHQVMLEHARQIIAAIRVLHKAMGFEQILVGIEENKSDAAERMREEAEAHADLPLKVITTKVKYPQGAEKHLIHALTGRVVPKGKLPLEVGAVVSNVQTIYAMYEAFYKGKPLIDRVLTVSGDGIASPSNVRAPLGTPLSNLYEFCGGITGEPRKMIAGGPMMGIALPTVDYSVMKGSSGYLLFTEPEVPEEGPCIMCGRCVQACPMNLVPLRIAALAKAEKFEEAKALDATSCVECGACAYRCPAKIRLVAWIRYAKNLINIRGL